jgi:hypothetical protein
MISSLQGTGSAFGATGLGLFPKPQPLTDDQKEQVQSILSDYDSENLTADDAKAIFKKLREAGIQGPGVREAIEDAGFDAEQVRSLAGNEGPGGPGGHGGPGGPGGPGKPGQSQGLNLSSLKSLQSILSQYDDLSSLTTEQQSNLFSQLTSSGLLKNGNLLDLSA